jgi:replicative DNA helicase
LQWDNLWKCFCGVACRAGIQDDARMSALPISEQSSGPASYRQVPHDYETEQALLGAILVNNDAYERVSQFLEALHFYDPLHQRIYDACAMLIRQGKLASPATLRGHFQLDVAMKELGGPDYLAELAKFSPTVINSYDYGRLLYEMAMRRELIRVGEDLVATAFDPPLDQDAPDLIEETEKQLYTIAERGRFGGGFKTFRQSLTGAIELAEKAFQSSTHVSGIPTGFVDIDFLLGGLQGSDLVILAARPGMGKTSLATNIAFYAAREYARSGKASGAPVAFFSLEMSAEQLATRVLSEQCEISSSTIRRGKINQQEFESLARMSAELEQIPLYIDDTGGLSIAQVAARCRRLKRSGNLGLIMIDYLQLLAGTANRRNENRVQEITEITKGLKNLAKELNVPVLAMSQLSRGVDNRDDKRPVLADLRESGSIEQDADVVMFIYREAYYLATKPPSEDDPDFLKWQEKMNRIHDEADILIEKHRHGPTGRVTLKFEKEFTRFYNLAKEDHMPERTR